jgi:hypothetical protein
MMLRADDILWTASAAVVQAETGTTLAALLHDLRAYIYRYVVVTPEQALTIALWIAVTHVLDAFDTVAYLSITSATKRSGKTRLLEILEAIVRRPWLTGRTSAAALVRKVDAEAPTLLLDEGDTAFKGDQEYSEMLRGILNSGYKRNGMVTLCVGKGADITTKDFSTFSAKAIAGIGQLPDTVADRSIPIELKRRMSSEPVQRWRERDGHAEAEPLRHRLMAWREAAIEPLRAARPVLPEELSDRAADVWEALFAVADMAGGDWPVRTRRAAVALMGSVDDTDPTIELLKDIFAEVMPDESRQVIPTEEIRTKLIALEHRPWATWRRDKPISARGLARLLDPLGVHPIRLEHLRGYRRDAFEGLIARYLPIQASLRQPTNNDGPKSRDGCVSEGEPKNPSVPQFEADSIGLLTHSHIEAEDESDEHF